MTDTIDAARIDGICDALIDAAHQLRRMPTDRVIRAIDTAAARLRDHDDAARAKVLRSLEDVSGFSAPMAAHVLDRITMDWSAPALEQLLRDELGGAERIESFTRIGGGRRVRAIAPLLGLHVFAGNVPGTGVTSIIRALLVRSAVIGKTAAAEPALAPAFASALHEADPDVGRCVAVMYWHGGDVKIEEAVLRRVGLVVHYGGADAIRDLRARAPAHVRFVEHGPRISFALIRADGANDAAPHDLAMAVALFDQQGCVSPQIAYVIGTREQARDFAAATAAALDRIAHDLPRGRIDAAEAAAIREVRARAEFGAIGGRDTALWAPADLGYSVILSDSPEFAGSCLNRTLIVKHVPDLATVAAHAAPAAALLQTVGIAGFPDDTIDAVATTLADVGATRITSLAEMPWPPPGWHHDGRGPLTELVRWVDLEG